MSQWQNHGDNSICGQITYTGIGYTVATNQLSCTVGYFRRGFPEYRIYFTYDTSMISDQSKITKVEFHHGLISSSTPGPMLWRTAFYMGTWIGPSLDSTDWNGGNFCVYRSGVGWPGTEWVDLGVPGTKNINTTGQTDLMIKDASLWNWFDPLGWTHVIYMTTHRGGALRITFNNKRKLTIIGKPIFSKVEV